MQIFSTLLNFILHVDSNLNALIQQYGALTHAIIAAIIFCETGLVFTPFLPGDSLIFAAGAFAARGSLNIWLLAVAIPAAALIGDNVNYWVGYYLGERLTSKGDRWFLKQKHLDRTQEFFKKHGGKAISMGRFVPIVRTFVPFVAGAGKMEYKTFLTFSIAGAIIWVALFLGAGYFFGNIGIVKRNFEMVILAIICISIIPPIVEALRSRKKEIK